MRKSEERQVGEFDRVELAGIWDVTITQGDHTTLTVEGDERVLARLSTEVDGGVLKLRTPCVLWPLWLRRELIARLAVKDLRELRTSGANHVRSAGALQVESLLLSTSGVDRAELTLKARSVEVKMSGAGEVRLSGSADRLHLKSSGTGHFYAKDLPSREVTVEASGASDIAVFALERLNVSTSGTGTVAYGGNPVVVQNSSGLSKVVALAS